MKSRIAAAAAALMVAAAACAPASSTEPSGHLHDTAKNDGGSSAPGCGDLAESIGDADCATCAGASCCDELLACDSGTACGALVDCIGACSDDACIASCNAQYPDGGAPRDALLACLDGACASVCTGPQQGVCGTTFTTGTAACDACVASSCCTALEACVSDATCSSCLDGNAAAADCPSNVPLGDVRACFSASCASVCDG